MGNNQSAGCWFIGIILALGAFAGISMNCQGDGSKPEAPMTTAEEDRVYGPFPRMVERGLAKPVADWVYSRCAYPQFLVVSPLYKFASNGTKGWKQTVRWKGQVDGAEQVREDAFLIYQDRIVMTVPAN